MKKIVMVLAAMFLIGLSVNAQTQPSQNKVKTVKVSTKHKILQAVQSKKAKAAFAKSKQEMRKEGE